MQGGFGGMLSIRLAGGAEHATAVLQAVRVFKRATSLGGVESLIEHRAEVEGPSSPVPADLLRLSIEKAVMQLGWRPVWAFRETIRQTAAWYRKFYEGSRGAIRHADEHVSSPAKISRFGMNDRERESHRYRCIDCIAPFAQNRETGLRRDHAGG